YSAFSTTALTATSAFSFNCTPPATALMTITTGGSGTFNPRHMSKAGGTMAYNLYMDAANSIIWGDGTSGTQYLTFSATPGNKDYPPTGTAAIYATIPAGLNVAPGTYTDTVNVILNWGSGSLTQPITITATVSAECTVSTVSITFGAYDPVVTNAATPLDSTGTVNVYCTTGTLATVSLDLGSHFTGTTRRMLSGAANFMTYEIYKDAGRTVVWNSTNTNSGTSTSKTIPINSGFIAYGRIPAGQDIPAGGYNDTVLVTVNY
ncbi:MAG TPA: spore coat U domain-containing protein, partial [Thermoanaerobaculia bacterium]|nr:spore coat U domain-containing protein [Thermoanaerobaculia bacterium]